MESDPGGRTRCAPVHAHGGSAHTGNEACFVCVCGSVLFFFIVLSSCCARLHHGVGQPSGSVRCGLSLNPRHGRRSQIIRCGAVAADEHHGGARAPYRQHRARVCRLPTILHHGPFQCTHRWSRDQTIAPGRWETPAVVWHRCRMNAAVTRRRWRIAKTRHAIQRSRHACAARAFVTTTCRTSCNMPLNALRSRSGTIAATAGHTNSCQ